MYQTLSKFQEVFGQLYNRFSDMILEWLTMFFFCGFNIVSVAESDVLPSLTDDDCGLGN